MNILLVNDDGINSSRLKFTKKILETFGNVVVVAPKEQQSGKSVAISIKGFKYETLSDSEFAIEGTPADCVNFGIRGLDTEFDLVVSGTNKGYNLGVDTMYSGTVGAALQASYLGYDSIALSADFRGSTKMKRLLKECLEYIFDNELTDKNHVVNVNFPKENTDNYKGIKCTKTYFIKYNVLYEFKDDYFLTKRELLNIDFPIDSDYYAVNNGWISISNLSLRQNEV